jgi:hypothetical protein
VWVRLKGDAGLSNLSSNLQIDSQITAALIQSSNCDRILDKFAKSIIAMSKAPMHPEKCSSSLEPSDPMCSTPFRAISRPVWKIEMSALSNCSGLRLGGYFTFDFFPSSWVVLHFFCSMSQRRCANTIAKLKVRKFVHSSRE